MYFSVHCSATQSKDEDGSQQSKRTGWRMTPGSHPVISWKRMKLIPFTVPWISLLVAVLRGVFSSVLYRKRIATWQSCRLLGRGCISSTELLRVIAFNLDTNDMHYHNIIIRSDAAGGHPHAKKKFNYKGFSCCSARLIHPPPFKRPKYHLVVLQCVVVVGFHEELWEFIIIGGRRTFCWNCL